MKVFIHLLATLLIASFGWLRCSPAFADEANCRTALPPSEIISRGGVNDIAVFTRDVDGDDIADSLHLHKSRDNAMSRAQGTLTQSASRDTVEISTTTSFFTMINIHIVPAELAGTDQTEARRLVEDALFDRVCSQPDPSLSWLLDLENTVAWREGRPALPGSYTVYFPEAPIGLIPFIGAWSELGLGSEHPVAVWVEYSGATHAPTSHDLKSKASLLDNSFELLATTSRYRVLGTRHAVAILDVATGRYAWLYVFRGGHKLLWRSVASATINGGEVAITAHIKDPEAQQAGIITVNLFNDGYAETWTPQASNSVPDGQQPR